jgi:hypothetical protein
VRRSASHAALLLSFAACCCSHCFSDVSAILFIVNTAGYNSVLFEDASKNRLQEELELFEQITGLPIFAHTPIHLFLNKKDRQPAPHRAAAGCPPQPLQHSRCACRLLWCCCC